MMVVLQSSMWKQRVARTTRGWWLAGRSISSKFLQLGSNSHQGCENTAHPILKILTRKKHKNWTIYPIELDFCWSYYSNYSWSIVFIYIYLSWFSILTSELVMPLRAAISTSGLFDPSKRHDFCFICATCRIRSVVFKSSWNECKFLLFTPMTLAPQSRAISISRSVCTSTRGSIPCLREKLIKSFNWLTPNTATIKRTVSAPCARASSIWYL